MVTVILRTACTLAAASAVALLTACEGAAPQPPVEQTPPPGPGEDVLEPSDVDSATTGLGTILVDSQGMALYLFTEDEQGEPTCYDECAQNWPPLVVENREPVVGPGLDEASAATVEREDGPAQVTYNGHPLYRHAQDTAAGEVGGQGAEGAWYAIGVDGEPVEEGAGG